MKKSIRVFVIAIGVAASLFLLSFIIRSVSYYNMAYEKTSISKFKVCTMDNPIGNVDSACGNSFSVGIKELYACGYVNADYLEPSDFIALSIYLDNDKATLPLYQNKIEDHFTNGNFCRKIIVPKNTRPGLFTIKVYFYRKIVATAKIVLK